VPPPETPPRPAPGTRLYLTPAAHLLPEDGTCLMEAVSAAAGLSWSDNPTCTHPLLAHLARLVNDASTEAGRQVLLELIPGLANATSDAPARASASLASACTDYALRLRPTQLLIHLHHVTMTQLRREQRLPARGTPPWVSAARQRVFLHGPGARAVEQSVRACTLLPPAERDGALLTLLRLGLAAVTGDAAGVPLPGHRNRVLGGLRSDAQADTTNIVSALPAGDARAQAWWRWLTV
jgi:hypothetical protein